MPEPKTVLYLTPSSRLLGARRSLLQLATNLDPARYRPVVAVQGPGDLVDALEAAGVETRTLFLGRWRKGRYMLQRPLRIRQLARLARDEGAGLIHCNEFFPNPYAVRAAAKAGGIPVVTHMRLSITPRRIRNYDMRRADRVVAVSHAAARDFAAAWADWEERVEVVYNGVDLGEFRPTVGREAARRKLGLEPGDFVVGQFGLLAPRKQVHVAVAAVARLKEELPRIRLLVVGSPGRSDHDYAAQLTQTVEREELGDIVRFIPFTPEVAELYQACDVNLQIADDEGFGRTVIEAGALGVPTIGTRAGGIPELIEDGRTGVLISAEDDGSELAGAIGRMSREPERLADLGRAARSRVEECFAIERHASEIMRVYDEVLSEGR